MHWYRILQVAVLILVTAQTKLHPQTVSRGAASFRVMTFNVLQGGGNASNVGLDNELFLGSRIDEIAAVIKQSAADIVGVQEDSHSDRILRALGDDWQRIGAVYSKFPLQAIHVDTYLTVVEAALPDSRRVVIVNCHWFPSNGYGPDLAQAQLKADPTLSDLAATTEFITTTCAIPDGPRGYNATLKPLKDAMDVDKPVILTGDFNEPSHLDWTNAYAKHGRDRWVNNPTGTPLRMPVPWPGSMKLAQIGMVDSFRKVHPDEVAKPGFTWTPKYPQNTPGRRPYANQVLDRIDRVYHHGHGLTTKNAAVVGEDETFADIVFDGRWPSDHRAVIVEFEFQK